MGPGIEENQLSKTANWLTREGKAGIDRGLKPTFVTVCERLELGRDGYSLLDKTSHGRKRTRSKTCSSAASKEWLGSGSNELRMNGDCRF